MTNTTLTDRRPADRRRIPFSETALGKFLTLAMGHGFTQAEGEHIIAIYQQERVIKFAIYSPDFEIKHGALLDRDVMARALAMPVRARKAAR